jgi:hypothetical protein
VVPAWLLLARPMSKGRNLHRITRGFGQRFEKNWSRGSGAFSLSRNRTGFDLESLNRPLKTMNTSNLTVGFLCNDQYCTRYIVGTRGKGEANTGTNHLGFRCVTTPELWKDRVVLNKETL